MLDNKGNEVTVRLVLTNKVFDAEGTYEKPSSKGFKLAKGGLAPY